MFHGYYGISNTDGVDLLKHMSRKYISPIPDTHPEQDF